MSLSQNEQYLTEQIELLEHLVAQRQAQLSQALESVELLESVVHKAAQIAGHLPYLCSSLPEPSLEIEQASLQLQQLLVQRKA